MEQMTTRSPSACQTTDACPPLPTFADELQLVVDFAGTITELAILVQSPGSAHTAAFIHLPSAPCSMNVEGDGIYVRIQVLNADTLDREKQLAVVRQLTEIVVTAASDGALTGRTWIQLADSLRGGWSAGQARTTTLGGRRRTPHLFTPSPSLAMVSA